MTGNRIFRYVGEAARPVDPWQLIAHPTATRTQIAVELPAPTFAPATFAPPLLSQMQQAPCNALPLAGAFMGKRRMEMRQDACLTIDMEQRQTITLRSSYAVPEAFFASLAPHSILKSCTVQGLDFSYYLVPREHAAYFFAVGSMSLQFGPYCFVVDRFIPDLPAEAAARLETLAAVHVYGAMVLGDHHLASMLELAVAEREGYLEWYLELLETTYGGKFRDLMFKHLAPLLKQALQRTGITGLSPTFTEPPTAPAEVLATISAIRAKALAEECRSHFALRHSRLAARFADYLTPTPDQLRAAAKRLADFIVVADQLDVYLRLAKSGAMTTARKAVEAKHNWQTVLQQARVAWLQPFVRYAWELHIGILPPVPPARQGHWRTLIDLASEEIRTQLLALLVSHGTPVDLIETAIMADTVLAMDAGALLNFARAEHNLLAGVDAFSFTASTNLTIITHEATDPRFSALHRRLLEAVETMDAAVLEPERVLRGAARKIQAPTKAPTTAPTKPKPMNTTTRPSAPTYSDSIATVMMHCALDRNIPIASVFTWAVENTALFFTLDVIRGIPAEDLSTGEGRTEFKTMVIECLRQHGSQPKFAEPANHWLQQALRDLQQLLEIIHRVAPDHPWVSAGLPQVPRLTALMVSEQLIEQLGEGLDFMPTDLPHAELRKANIMMTWDEFRKSLGSDPVG